MLYRLVACANYSALRSQQYLLPTSYRMGFCIHPPDGATFWTGRGLRVYPPLPALLEIGGVEDLFGLRS